MVARAFRDLRQAIRTIGRMPTVATVVVLSIGAGVGVNTVVFSWIEARVLKPLGGVPNGGGFYGVEVRNDAGMYTSASWPEYEDLRERLRSIPDLVAFRMVPLYVGDAGQVERTYGLLVSGNYFSALGLKPALGRFLAPEEAARPGGEPVGVISYTLWQRRFGGTPDALGRTVRLNGTRIAIVGVTPKAFLGTVSGLSFDIYLPATLAPVVIGGSGELRDRGFRGYQIIGALADGTSRPQAQSELDAAMRGLASAYPPSNGGFTAEVLPFWKSPRGPQRLLTAALTFLQAIMLLLLLAVCGNTANLMLARASARRREIGVRLALGATPRDIARLLLAENVVLGIAGAALGAGIAAWGTQALLVLPLSGLPLRFDTHVDGGALVFAMALGLLCGVIFGAAPAAHLARLDPQAALRTDTGGPQRSRMRDILMGVQAGLALVVLIVAGLFFRSVMDARDLDTGFRREGVLLAAYDLTGRNATREFTRAFPRQVLDRLRELADVEDAAIATSVPLDIHGLPSRPFTVDGHRRSDNEEDRALTNTVTPGYFRTMHIPLRAGADFVALDDPSARPQAIVNEEFVRRYLGALEPIGRRLQVRGREFSIAGVARDSTYNAFGEPPTPIIYLSYRDVPSAAGEIHVRARRGTAGELANEVRRGVREIEPDLPVFNVRTLADHVETNLIFRRIPARMFAVLGPLLLVLAAIGIYAVVAYSVSLRTKEIGVRLALGGTSGQLVARFVGEHLRVIATGALVGWTLAFAIALDVAAVQSIDLAVFAGVPALLLAVAAAACWLPARRAASLDPMAALRQE
ncbi:MAG: hypothetical protein A3H96_12875 [Acidobacteria bacterium RIFCSPLOWO2_02_FULL_67_36]|nr:MAG: hypothetical protein A3H96_12875 [Acidobacteria bacterium RIFCSPLOWO2_02_FULL_67_36]OFW23516.1 MAG: hypothetical protein A3G21_06185 [Acidobacteria bacterium RIFCSPLOWO2_12_FULL_66_21]